MKLLSTGLVLAIFSGFLFVSADAAIVKVPFSGQLSENGQLLNGTYELTFNIYSAPTGGTFYGSAVESVLVQDGIFHSDLDISEDLFGGADIYLAISKNSEPELSPRIPVNYVPQSIYARKAGLAFQALNADYATVAGSVAGGQFPVGINFNVEPTPASFFDTSTLLDSVAIGVPAAGHVVVSCSAEFVTNAITLQKCSLYLTDMKTNPRIFYRGGFTNFTDAGTLEAGLSTISWNGVFPVPGTIPGGKHVYYLYREPNSPNVVSPSGRVKMIAVWYPVRYDQPEN